jgi:hypothetical protein
MKEYLETLHTRTPEHKHRFALVTSGGFTLIIFTFWAMATFGVDNSTMAKTNSKTAKQEITEVSPLDSLLGSVIAAFNSIRGGTGDLKGGLEVVDFQGKYTDLKEDTLNTYAR